MQFEVNILSFPPFFYFTSHICIVGRCKQQFRYYSNAEEGFFSYMILNSQIMKFVFQINFTQLKEIIVYIKPYLGTFWKENTWKHLDTWRWRYSVPSEHEDWLHSHAALYLRRKPSTTLLWKPQNMHPRKLPTTSFMSNKILCCVTKLLSGHFNFGLAWIILKGLNESLMCVFWIYV
jgi:hypothetical protein